MTALNDSIYAVVYRGYSYDGYIETFKVSPSGQITRLQSFEYDTNESQYNKLIQVDSNTVAILFRGYQGSWGGHVMTLDIAADGSSITKVATKKFIITSIIQNLFILEMIYM